MQFMQLEDAIDLVVVFVVDVCSIAYHMVEVSNFICYPLEWG